jgi:phi LC3 family holin
MKINWKVRFKNPVFITQLVISVLAPILAYTGLSYADLTTWGALFDVLKQAVSNPYVLGFIIISLYNAVTDPTTKGHKDSLQAQTYQKPRKDKDR